MRLTIAGSMSFYDDFVKIKRFLEQKGHEVSIPIKEELPEPVPLEYKRKAMDVFNKKLARAEAVLVVNKEKNGKNYVGVNTLMEIGMAFNQGKQVYLLHAAEEEMKHELEAITCVVLEGDLSKIPLRP